MNSLILLMAGCGSRMEMDINKVLLPLGDKKIFEYSLDLFSKYDFEIICVVNKDDDIKLPDNVKMVYGGKTRMESVYNGLLSSKGDYVFIHDAARPFLKEEVLKELLDLQNDNVALLTTSEVKDTIRINENGVLRPLDRSLLVGASTPQCAPKSIILEAYKRGIEDNKLFTDDISLIEYYYPNFEIKLVKGNNDNFKITTKVDYELAKMIWRKYA